MAVMFQKTELNEPLPENKSQALPAHRPNVASVMPGGKEGKTSGRYPKGMKTLPIHGKLSLSAEGRAFLA